MSTIPLSAVEAFLHAEARALDDRDWDTWLAFYAPDASFWMPAWDDNDKLVEDPQAEISLIYYARRSGLEDRVFRIKTERSSASTPEPRTSHNISNVEILSQSDSKSRTALQLADAQLSLQNHRHLFWSFLLHARNYG